MTTSTTQDQSPDIRVFQKLIILAGNGQFTGYQDVAHIGKLQALLGILFDHDDGLALGVLNVIQNFKDHVDETRL